MSDHRNWQFWQSVRSCSEYSTSGVGKIVKVEKQESHVTSTGTDAHAKANVATYRVSIQLDDKVYVCRYQTHHDADVSWIEGKDVQARVSGKVMYVKNAARQRGEGIDLEYFCGWELVNPTIKSHRGYSLNSSRMRVRAPACRPRERAVYSGPSSYLNLADLS